MGYLLTVRAGHRSRSCALASQGHQQHRARRIVHNSHPDGRRARTCPVNSAEDVCEHGSRGIAVSASARLSAWRCLRIGHDRSAVRRPCLHGPRPAAPSARERARAPGTAL